MSSSSFSMLLLNVLAILIGNLHTTACTNLQKLSLLTLNDYGLYGRCECSVLPWDPKVMQEREHPDKKTTVHLGELITASPTPAPMKGLESIVRDFLYGHKTDGKKDSSGERDANFTQTFTSNETNGDSNNLTLQSERIQLQFPTGHVMHSDLFRNKSGVHLPPPDLLHAEHCRLRQTDDHMQTAVDAFAIILDGSLLDVQALPSDYVLRSARTISIMKIPQEKLAAMWDVVLGGRKPDTITYETLEMFRPLFKYVNGKQMAKLNLSDTRIVNYIGTHPGLDRHQVGVVASKYIRVNPEWKQAKYLNNMNNLLCGVPMSFMRRIDGTQYLRLEHQVFYHVKACDPLQKRFYLNMMTRTQALGKSFSWSARDVSRLGLLLSVVEGPALAAISPEAMSGITAHVMAELQPKNLRYITETQMLHIKPKPKNILARKLKQWNEDVMANAGFRDVASVLLRLIMVLCCPQIFMK